MNTLNLSTVDEAIEFSEQMIELASRAFRFTKFMAIIAAQRAADDQHQQQLLAAIQDYIKAVEQNELTIAAFQAAIANTKALRAGLAAAPAGAVQ